MTVQIAIRIPDAELAAVDESVRRGRYPNRTAAIRAALAMLVREEESLAIAEEYRRAYAAAPEEDWVLDVADRLARDAFEDAAT